MTEQELQQLMRQSLDSLQQTSDQDQLILLSKFLNSKNYYDSQDGAQVSAESPLTPIDLNYVDPEKIQITSQSIERLRRLGRQDSSRLLAQRQKAASFNCPNTSFHDKCPVEGTVDTGKANCFSIATHSNSKHDKKLTSPCKLPDSQIKNCINNLRSKEVEQVEPAGDENQVDGQRILARNSIELCMRPKYEIKSDPDFIPFGSHQHLSREQLLQEAEIAELLFNLHNRILGTFVLTAFDLSRQIHITPKRIEYVRIKEHQLYVQLLDLVGAKNRHLQPVICESLTSLKPRLGQPASCESSPPYQSRQNLLNKEEEKNRHSGLQIGHCDDPQCPQSCPFSNQLLPKVWSAQNEGYEVLCSKRHRTQSEHCFERQTNNNVNAAQHLEHEMVDKNQQKQRQTKPSAFPNNSFNCNQLPTGNRVNPLSGSFYCSSCCSEPDQIMTSNEELFVLPETNVAVDRRHRLQQLGSADYGDSGCATGSGCSEQPPLESLRSSEPIAVLLSTHGQNYRVSQVTKQINVNVKNDRVQLQAQQPTFLPIDSSEDEHFQQTKLPMSRRRAISSQSADQAKFSRPSLHVGNKSKLVSYSMLGRRRLSSPDENQLSSFKKNNQTNCCAGHQNCDGRRGPTLVELQLSQQLVQRKVLRLLAAKISARLKESAQPLQEQYVGTLLRLIRTLEEDAEDDRPKIKTQQFPTNPASELTRQALMRLSGSYPTRRLATTPLSTTNSDGACNHSIQTQPIDRNPFEAIHSQPCREMLPNQSGNDSSAYNFCSVDGGWLDQNVLLRPKKCKCLTNQSIPKNGEEIDVTGNEDECQPIDIEQERHNRLANRSVSQSLERLLQAIERVRLDQISGSGVFRALWQRVQKLWLNSTLLWWRLQQVRLQQAVVIRCDCEQQSANALDQLLESTDEEEQHWINEFLREEASSVNYSKRRTRTVGFLDRPCCLNRSTSSTRCKCRNSVNEENEQDYDHSRRRKRNGAEEDDEMFFKSFDRPVITGGCCGCLARQWRRKAAQELIGGLSESRLSRCIGDQLRSELRRAHEQFQQSWRQLELRHQEKRKRTEQHQLSLRKCFAPRIARFTLESACLRDQALYGMPKLGRNCS